MGFVIRKVNKTPHYGGFGPPCQITHQPTRAQPRPSRPNHTGPFDASVCPAAHPIISPAEYFIEGGAVRIASGWMRNVLLLLVLGLYASSSEAIERRRDRFGKEFKTFVYLFAFEIAGFGKASGFGATVLNMFGTDAEFSGFHLEDDFDASD